MVSIAEGFDGLKIFQCHRFIICYVVRGKVRYSFAVKATPSSGFGAWGIVEDRQHGGFFYILNMILSCSSKTCHTTQLMRFTFVLNACRSVD